MSSFSVWSPALFLNGNSNWILIYLACALLDDTDFYATCDDHLSYVLKERI